MPEEGRVGEGSPRLCSTFDAPSQWDTLAGWTAASRVKPDGNARAQERVENLVAILEASGNNSSGHRILVGERCKTMQALAFYPSGLRLFVP